MRSWVSRSAWGVKLNPPGGPQCVGFCGFTFSQLPIKALRQGVWIP
uniref:Uncharacterized protein n=2 Tax=Anguilla anguilla TaxID=7936 RepID=A0A0E9TPH1_ANGAN